jgi:hypothetical protein
MHRELADDGLAGPGRGADQDSMAGLQCGAGTHLERIETEGKLRGETEQFRTGLG